MELTPGITKADAGYGSEPWNVVGHTYTPKIVSEDVFVWHAVLPDTSFVPPHIHPTQDEWITVLTGKLEVEFGADVHHARAGDTIRMPRGIAHGIFNRSGDEATALFGVAPTRSLFELFRKLDGVTDPDELVRISAQHEVEFLPPPDAR
ncbi:MAG: cupin domain-containing protein [Pseudomonadota bacterium]